jgi:hypothetical protein
MNDKYRLKLQQQLIEIYQLEEALRAEIKEKLDELKRLHTRRIEINQLLNPDSN